MKTNTRQSETEGDEIQEPVDEGEKETAEKPEIAADDETGGVVVREHIRKPATRRERREQHQSDEAARLRQENEDLRRQFDAHRQQTDLTLQQLRQSTQQIQQQGTDPHKARMKSIRAEQELIQNQVRASQDTAEVERLKQRFYELGDEYEDLRDTRVLTRAEEIAKRQAAAAAQNGQGEEAILRTEFPEILPPPGQQFNEKQARALRYAHGLYNTMVADNEPATIATSRKAMAAAAEKFGFRQPTMPAPSLAQQQRFGSLPIQAGQHTTRNETRLNKQQMSMAISRWPNVPEEQAYANMARALADLERREKAGFGDEIS